MDVRLTADRIAHGTDHMRTPSLVLRVAAVLFGASVALTSSDLVFGVLASLITVAAGVVALWELYDAAIECEEEFDDDVDDSDETGFGTAA